MGGSETVTTVVPTTTAMALAGVDAGLLGIVSVVVLIVVLVAKELVSVEAKDTGKGSRSQFLSTALNAPILALLGVFAVLVIVRIWEVL